MKEKILNLLSKHKILILSSIILLHILFVFFSMNQPFHGDESVFPEAAKGVLETGKPIFNYSLLHPNMIGLWHPPTYIYIMSIFIKTFGDNIYSIRAVSALFNVFTIISVFLISQLIFKERKNKEVFSLFAAAIYALNPLTIQSSVLIDIDGGLLNFAICLFLYYFIQEKSYYYLIPSLLLVFLSKETGVIVLFLTLLIFSLITKSFKTLKKTLLIFISTAVIFIALFWTYTSLLNLNAAMPLTHNFLKITEIFHLNLVFWIRSAWSSKGFFYFAIPFFMLLFALFSYSFYKRLIKSKSIENKPILLLNLFSLITILFFFYLGANNWGFPKYYITAMPGIAIFIAYSLSKIDLTSWLRQYRLIIISIAILTAYFLIFIPSPLNPEFDSTAQNADLTLALGLIAKTFLLYVIIPIIIVALVLLLNKFENKIYLIFILLTFFVYFFINISHAFVDYSTYSTYGDKGAFEVIQYLKDSNISSTNIAAYSNIGSYLGISNYYEITFIYTNSSIFKEKAINNPQLRYIIIYERDIARIGQENMAHFSLNKKIGTYYIYQKIKRTEDKWLK